MSRSVPQPKKSYPFLRRWKTPIGHRQTVGNGGTQSHRLLRPCGATLVRLQVGKPPETAGRKARGCRAPAAQCSFGCNLANHRKRWDAKPEANALLRRNARSATGYFASVIYWSPMNNPFSVPHPGCLTTAGFVIRTAYRISIDSKERNKL